MAKKVEAYIKLQVAAGMANPSPPVEPVLISTFWYERPRVRETGNYGI